MSEKKIKIKLPFFEKKFDFLYNHLTDWAEIFNRKITKQYASNESYPKILLQSEQELRFYEDLKISLVLFLSVFYLMVNNKL